MTPFRIEMLLPLAALGLLATGCILVMTPFLSPLLWSVIVCYSTWGLYQRLVAWTGGRSSRAALAMTLCLAAVLIVPTVVLASRLTDNMTNLSRAVSHVVDEGLPTAPDWLHKVPLVGDAATGYWNDLHDSKDGSEVVHWLQQQAAPVSRWLLGRGLAFGEVLLQLLLSVFAAYYIYRDGLDLSRRLNAAMERIAGKRAYHLLTLTGATIRGVVYGVLGTALMQGTIASFGFLVAGVPGPMLLGLLTAIASIIPGAPPLVWVPAILWLVHQDQMGWALFMTAWGVLVISGIDHFVKPYLISQGASLPFLLVLLGIIGGILTFGFIGIFLGPTLLAVGYTLVREWTHENVIAGAGETR
ncbi:MAG: AI-2E family transporter [Gammaproteobacteria bacterium]|nr:AI-2E family transporter [Gammaproteobacteria bacterium]MBI5616402.1 AI-2E family transporter [Gammaproteobacteria bacterium]